MLKEQNTEIILKLNLESLQSCLSMWRAESIWYDQNFTPVQISRLICFSSNVSLIAEIPLKQLSTLDKFC